MHDGDPILNKQNRASKSIAPPYNLSKIVVKGQRSYLSGHWLKYGFDDSDFPGTYNGCQSSRMTMPILIAITDETS